MFKPLLLGAILSTLLAGCHAPAVLQATPIEVEGVVSGSLKPRLLPAGTPTVGPKANTGIRPNLTPRGTNGSSALAGVGGVQVEAGSEADSAAAPALKWLDAEAPSLKLVPILDEDDQFASMMASPKTGALTWRLQGVAGPLNLGSAQVMLRREAIRPSLGAEVPDPEATPEPAVGEPMSFELAPGAIGLPAATRAGTSYSLSLSLLGDEARAFITANPTASQVSVVVTLSDADGAPIPGPDGAPLTLTARVSVL